MDEDATEAAWDQLAQEERWRREDAALERHRALLAEFRRESAVFDEETEAFNERVRKHHGNHCV